MRLCDQAIWLDSGEIKASGDPKHVTEKYMEELYEGPRKSSVIDKGEAVGADDGQSTVNDNVGKKTRVRKDKRLDYVDDEKSRNDIQISEFNRYAMSFGRGGAKITDVVLEDEIGDQLSWVVGGELVSLRIACEIKQKLASPIIGFFVKDRLGQALFGDNSFSMHAKQSGIITKGQRVEAVFQFYMPLLPTGDYSVCVAIANGSIETHVQHHWIHDALIFKVISSSIRNCLVGIPMQNIELNIQS